MKPEARASCSLGRVGHAQLIVIESAGAGLTRVDLCSRVNSEGVQFGGLHVENEPHRLACEFLEAIGLSPSDSAADIIGLKRQAILSREAGDRFAIGVENLNSDPAVFRISVYLQVSAGECHELGCRAPFRIQRIERDKSIAPEGCQIQRAALVRELGLRFREVFPFFISPFLFFSSCMAPISTGIIEP